MADQATISLRLVANIDAAVRQLEKMKAKVAETGYAMVTPLQQANKKVTDSLAQSAAEVARFGQVTGGQRAFIQNFGYQISDMAVQIGGGTSVLRAFGQQVPQMLGPLGVLGAVLGTVIAVGVPLVQAFTGGGEAAKKLSDQVTDLGKAVSAYLDFADKAALPTDELAKRYGTATEAARTFLTALRDIDEIKVQDALGNITKSIAGSFGDLGGQSLSSMRGLEASLNYVQSRSLEIANQMESGQVTDPVKLQNLSTEQGDLDAMLQKMTGFRQMTEDAAIAMKLTRDQAAELMGRMADLANAKGLNDQTSAAKALTEAITQVYPDLSKMPPMMRTLYDNVAQAGESMAQLQGSSTKTAGGLSTASEAARVFHSFLSEAEAVMRALVGAQPGPGWLKDAIGQAETLKGKIWDAVDAWNTAQMTHPDVPRLAGGVDAIASGDIQLIQGHTRRVPPPPPAPSHVSSGGGTAKSPVEDYNQLMSSLDPVVAATRDYDKALETVNAAYARGAINEAEKAHALDLIQAKFNGATGAIKDGAATWSAFESAGATAFDSLIAGTGNLKSALKDMIKELEIALLKQALLGSIKGTTASQSVGSMLMTGISSLLGFRASGGPVQAGRPYVVGEKRPELFVPDTAGTILPAVPSMSMPANIMPAARSAPQVVQVQVSVDDDGKLKAIARQAGAAAAYPVSMQVVNQAFKVAARQQKGS